MASQAAGPSVAMAEPLPVLADGDRADGSASGEHGFLLQLLAEQQMTAVERFAAEHTEAQSHLKGQGSGGTRQVS